MNKKQITHQETNEQIEAAYNFMGRYELKKKIIQCLNFSPAASQRK